MVDIQNWTPFLVLSYTLISLISFLIAYAWRDIDSDTPNGEIRRVGETGQHAAAVVLLTAVFWPLRVVGIALGWSRAASRDLWTWLRSTP